MSEPTPASRSDWAVEHREGSAADLHALEVPDDGRRRIWVLQVTRPAVVLGSTQPSEAIDSERATAAGVDVARRRSGGGAVWVAPGDPIWIDIVVPRGDILWDDDVGASFVPIGQAWRRALAAVGVGGQGSAPLAVHDGGLVRTPWSALVCFAGTGPGEVTQGAAKVVGISQRRTRAGARFQCAVHRRWDPEPLRGLLAEPPPAPALAAAGLGIGDTVAVEDLLAALVAGLGRPALS